MTTPPRSVTARCARSKPRPSREPATAHPARRLAGWWRSIAGGPVRARVVLLLACVLGLDTADLGSVGAIAGKLEHSLALSNTELGLLAATPSICSALATVPMGVLVDRSPRVRLLWITMLTWSVAEMLSGAATPAVASLVGDLFPARERARIWGLILGGELVGAAFGYLIAGEAATLGSGSWRYAFYALALPSFLGAVAVRRWLPEPARGGRSRLRPGATRFVTAADAAPGRGPAGESDAFEETKAQEKVAEKGMAPVQALVLRSDPEAMSLWRATTYILRIRTNLVLIAASALGYFYFTGVTTFGLVYFQGRYHLAHGTATLLVMLVGVGGLVGVLVGGRLADRWLERGNVNSRIIVAAASFALAALFFLPGLLTASVAISLPLFMLAGIAFGARNPPLDAARLDIMHHRLWGRAEAVRTLLRRSMTAAAPVVFGLIADQLAVPQAHASPSGAHGFAANTSAQGLRLAFLVLLITLALGGILTYVATRTYPRDVATGLASETQTRSDDGEAPVRAAA
jgi:MFS family permease